MILAIFLFTILSASGAPVNDPVWNEFKIKFGKAYSAAEDHYRYQVWKKNEQQINVHNALYSQTYTQGLNFFCDMTDKEFRSHYTCTHGNATEAFHSENKVFEPEPTSATTVNWVEKGYVTAVKNQGQCGSCYSFSATGALEGQWFKKTGQLVSLSEQQIVDCSGRYGNSGCGGGMMNFCFQYIKDNGGIASESSYPYRARQYQCRRPSHIAAKCTGYRNIRHRDENALRDSVAQVGPITVAIAVPKSWMNYRSGVYDNPQCGFNLGHAVLVVGYGTEGGKDYWLVKNSWGTRWGDNGYIKMSRNRNNQCGIASHASFPTV